MELIGQTLTYLPAWGNILWRVGIYMMYQKHYFFFIKGESSDDIVSLNNRKFRVFVRKEEKLIYFFDVTEQTEIEKMYEDQRTVLAIIYLDNYDEVTQGLDDQLRTNITSLVTSRLNEWALKYGAYLKRASSERFFVVLNESILMQMEKGKFDILDQVREETSKKEYSAYIKYWCRIR